MNFNFNYLSIAFPLRQRQRGRSQSDVICVTRGKTRLERRPLASADLPAFARGSQVLQELPGVIQMRKKLFLGHKLRRMHTTPAAPEFDGMLQVEHLVINDVLNGVTGHPRMIEHPAHDDGVVRRIVMSQAVAGMITAPGHARPSEKTVKIPTVQILKN